MKSDKEARYKQPQSRPGFMLETINIVEDFGNFAVP